MRLEGDDFNEPVSDSMRAILDGHIVLSRQLAHAGQYPAIDVLQSTSRVMPDITPIAQRELASAAVRLIALLERNRQLIDIGAYEKGSHDKSLYWCVSTSKHACRARQCGEPLVQRVRGATVTRSGGAWCWGRCQLSLGGAPLHCNKEAGT